MTGDGHAPARDPGGTNVVPPGVWVDETDEDDPVLRNADGSIVDTWRQDYPYPERLSREQYDHEKRQLQVELHSRCRLEHAVRDGVIAADAAVGGIHRHVQIVERRVPPRASRAIASAERIGMAEAPGLPLRRDERRVDQAGKNEGASHQNRG